MLEPVVMLVVIGLLSITSQLFAHKLKIPAILPLLLTGLVLGPGTGLLDSDALFADLLFPVVSLSVAIILFEGALTLNFKEIEGHGSVVRNLCTLGVLVTWLVVSPITHFVTGLPLSLSFLFGAIVTVTGPTVIMPMIRSVRPTKNVSSILRWEGIVIDPVGALLAVLVFEFLASQQDAFAHTALVFGTTIAIGSGLGLAAGFGLGKILRTNFIPSYLRNTAVLTVVLGAFEVSNLVAEESGLLTVTVMGIVLANMRNLETSDILEFKETLSVLLISGLFIILAARVELDALASIAQSAWPVILVMIVVARPLSVWLSSWGSTLNWQEKALISWIAPRGIVAAAVSALFALKLESQGYAEAQTIVSLVFLVILSTVVLQSLTSTWIASMLGQREPAPHGFLIFGANEFARALAKELKDADQTVKVSDTNWESISAARMLEIPTYFGNPSSEHAERTMDTTGIGYGLVLSPYKQLNPVVTHYLEDMFGNDKVMGLQAQKQVTSDKLKSAASYEKTLGLFGGATYSELASKLAKGASIKKTQLTESFTLEDYRQKYANRYVPLFAVDPKQRVHISHEGEKFTPDNGWKVVSLISPADSPDKKDE